MIRKGVVKMNKHDLFSTDAVFVSDKEDKYEVFNQVYTSLYTNKYVNSEFLTNIITREGSYPTGIDTAPISKDLPNIAVPHTEGDFVNTRLIVPIKLLKPVSFHNMINPNQTFDVKFMFMILNNDPQGQANILAQIMDFMTQTPVDKLIQLFNFTDPSRIYQFLSENFKQAEL